MNKIRSLFSAFTNQPVWKKNIVFFLVLILFISGILRFSHLTLQSLWLDELATVVDSSPEHSVTYGIQKCADEYNCPPFFFILLWIWQGLLGSSEFTVRLFPAILGIIGVWSIYFLGREIFSKRIGVYASLFTAFNPFHLYHSQEVRSYTLLFLLSVLSYLYFIKLLKNPIKKNKIGFLVFTALMLYTHYFGLLVFSAQFLFFIWHIFNKKIKPTFFFLKSLAIPIIAPGFLFLPWIGPFLKMESLEIFWTKEPSPNFFSRYLYEYFGNVPFLALLLLFLAVSYLLIKGEKSNFSEHRLLLFSWIFLVMIIPYIRSFHHPSPLTPRNTIVILPALILLISAGLERINSRSFQYFLLVAIVLLFNISIFFSNGNYFTKPTKQQWRETVKFVIENDEKLEFPVFTIKNHPNFRFFKYYFQKIYKKNTEPIPRILDLESALSCYTDVQRNKISGFWILEAHDFIDQSVHEFLAKNLFIKKSAKFIGAQANLFVPKEFSLISQADWDKTGPEAITIFNKALQQNPSHPGADTWWEHLGKLYMNHGNAKSAVEAFQNVVQINPNKGWHRIQLGDALLLNEQTQEALTEYDQAIIINPDYDLQAWFHARRAEIFRLLQETEKSITALILAIHLDAESENLPNWLMALGKLHLQKGKPTAAVKVFKQAAQIVPENIQNHRLLGDAYFATGQMEEAAASYLKALELNPQLQKQPWIYLRLGQAYLKLDNSETAKNYFNKVLKLDPDNSQAKNLLGSLTK